MPQFQQSIKEKYRIRDTKVTEEQEALNTKWDYFRSKVFCSIPLSQSSFYTQPTKSPKTQADLQGFSEVKLGLQ